MTDFLVFTSTTNSKYKAGSLIQMLHAHEQKHCCETLYDEGRVVEAARLLLEIEDSMGEEMRMDKVIKHWLSGALHLN